MIGFTGHVLWELSDPLHGNSLMGLDRERGVEMAAESFFPLKQLRADLGAVRGAVGPLGFLLYSSPFFFPSLSFFKESLALCHVKG